MFPTHFGGNASLGDQRNTSAGRPGPDSLAKQRLVTDSSLSRFMRLAMAAGALGLIGVFALAGWLVPDPSGRGTHLQLGLGPCAFLTLTKRPCPSCGMTTSFAWWVRGKWVRSLRANPAGTLTALVSVGLIPWLLVGAIRGRPWGTRSVLGPLVCLMLAILALSLVAWSIRMIMGGME